MGVTPYLSLGLLNGLLREPGLPVFLGCPAAHVGSRARGYQAPGFPVSLGLGATETAIVLHER